MFRRVLFIVVVLSGGLMLASCIPVPASPAPAAAMPNPASVYCEQNGGKLELRQDASGGVAGVCVFPDGSECDEWAYYRGECGPAGQSAATPLTAPEGAAGAPTDLPTPLPIDPADYAGWWTYTNPTYHFSLRLPPDWVVDETTAADPLMNGHLLNLHPRATGDNLNIRMTFRQVGEETLLWPTGVGSGEFIPLGTLDVSGQAARRVLFICPSGQVNSIWYHQSEDETDIRRADLEFGFILGYTGVYCQEGYSLGGKVQRVGEMIIASLQTP